MKMILHLSYFLMFLAAAATQILEVDPSCPTCVVVNGDSCYNSTSVLKFNAPFRNNVVIHKMGLHRANNTLYYSFEPAITDEEYFKIGFVNLDNPEVFGVFTSPGLILDFGTFDIDQDNQLVYMGGSTGIFVLDTKELKLAPYSSRGDTIRGIFYKNNVNFVKNDDKGITVKRGDNFNLIFEDIYIKDFVITKYDVIVYLSNFGLFVGKGDVHIRVSRNAFFRGLKIDMDDTVYAWWIDGIYKVVIGQNLEESEIMKVVSLPIAIGALAFDNQNNMLFTAEKELFRLYPTEKGCREKKNKEIVRI